MPKRRGKRRGRDEETPSVALTIDNLEKNNKNKQATPSVAFTEARDACEGALETIKVVPTEGECYTESDSFADSDDVFSDDDIPYVAVNPIDPATLRGGDPAPTDDGKHTNEAPGARKNEGRPLDDEAKPADSKSNTWKSASSSSSRRSVHEMIAGKAARRASACDRFDPAETERFLLKRWQRIEGVLRSGEKEGASSCYLLSNLVSPRSHPA